MQQDGQSKGNEDRDQNGDWVAIEKAGDNSFQRVPVRFTPHLV